jgi:ABC-type multidrug transport system ATPase subunit
MDNRGQYSPYSSPSIAPYQGSHTAADHYEGMEPSSLPDPVPAPTPNSAPYHNPTIDDPKEMDTFDPEAPTKGLNAGVLMEWSDICYKVTMKQKVGAWKREKVEKALLAGVHGTAKPGEILAIMGGSGAGKTTLLDALAGRLKGKVQGTLRINGQVLPPGSSGGFSKAYVFQGDNLYAVLTVRETLLFAARLQLSSTVTSEQRKAVVERWLRILGLKEVENVKVGNDDLKGLSGGQRRRLSIGIDLLKEPKLIFLDEPISGLDSTSAYKVVKAVQELAVEDSRTVLMTIHQPSPRILHLLSTILVIASGRAVFQGCEDDIHTYLRDVAKRSVPGHITPVEFFLDVLEELRERKESLDALADYHDAQMQRRPPEEVEDVVAPPNPRKSHFKDYVTLLHRTFLIVLRTPELFIRRFLFCAVVGFLMSTMYWNLGTQFQDATTRVGFFLEGTATLTFSSVEVLPMFAAERVIVRREYFQGAYSVIIYALVQMTVWTLTLIPNSLIWTLASYWGVGLGTLTNYAWTFLFTWLMWFCIMFFANSFAMMMSAVILSPMTSSSVCTGIFAFMLNVSGYFVPPSRIPPYWIWLYYISQFKYADFGLATNYYDNVAATQFGCAPPNNNDASCTMTAQQILEYYDMNGFNQWASVGALLGLGLAWRMIHCAALHLRFYKLRIRT